MNELEQVLTEIWTALQTGVSDRRHGFHHPVMSTIGLNQIPRSRVVILRSADSATKTMRFNTDVRTEKWHELQLNSAISLSFYDEERRTQIRTEGTASLHKDDALTLAAWKLAQRMSRAAYATTPSPGTILAKPDDFTLPHSDDEIAAGYENFGLVVVKVKTFEWLFLRAGGHRRARFDLDNQQVQWLVP